MALAPSDLKKSIDVWHALYERNLKKLKPRDFSFRMYKKQNLALAFTGVRRCGKTFAAIQVAKLSEAKRVLYFNFEDPLFYALGTVLDLDELISVYSEYYGGPPELVIFDELQNVEGWERWARKAIDLGLFQLVITGSSAKMLSSEISTSLSGRCLEKKVWPLGFSDFLKFKNIVCQTQNEYLGIFREYQEWGGFPEVALSEDVQFKADLLGQYLSDIVLRDVVNRYEIRNKKTLDQITNYYFTNLSSLYSYTALKNALQTNAETAQTYTGYLSDAFLVFEINRYHYKLKVQMRDPKKLYVIDTGLRNVNVRLHQEDYGRQVENIVFLQLAREGCEVSYFKEVQETDFLITHHGKPLSAIQVCDSNMENPTTYQREVNGLLACLKKTKLKKGFILTRSREEKLKVDSCEVELMPVYQWLLTSSNQL